jgi:hypothetical protein
MRVALIPLIVALSCKSTIWQFRRKKVWLNKIVAMIKYYMGMAWKIMHQNTLKIGYVKGQM